MQMEDLTMPEGENESFDKEVQPGTLPNFPISSLKQFKKLEELVINDSNCEKLLVSNFLFKNLFFRFLMRAFFIR